MNPYSFSTGALFPLETEDALALVKKAGFGQAELMPQALSDVSDKSVLKFERVGLPVASIHFPLACFAMLYTAHRSMREDGRDFAKKLLLLGARLGTRVLVVHPHTPAPAGYARVLEEPVVDNLLWLADACREAGVTMAMENSPHTCPTAASLTAYVARLNHPGILPMVDTTEACEAGEDPVRFIRDTHPCHLHLSDYRDDRKHLPAGDGSIDWWGVKEALAEIGYAGLYVLEPSYRYYLDRIEEKLQSAYAFIQMLMEGSDA